MRVETNTAKLIVSPDEQRRRHRDFKKRYFTPPQPKLVPPPPAPMAAPVAEPQPPAAPTEAAVVPVAADPPVDPTIGLEALLVNAFKQFNQRPQSAERLEVTALRIISRMLGVSHSDLRVRDRSRPAVVQRSIAIAFVYEAADRRSLKHAGRLFERDHSTALHAYRKYDALVARAKALAAGEQP